MVTNYNIVNTSIGRLSVHTYISNKALLPIFHYRTTLFINKTFVHFYYIFLLRQSFASSYDSISNYAIGSRLRKRKIDTGTETPSVTTPITKWIIAFSEKRDAKTKKP